MCVEEREVDSMCVSVCVCECACATVRACVFACVGECKCDRAQCHWRMDAYLCSWVRALPKRVCLYTNAPVIISVSTCMRATVHVCVDACLRTRVLFTCMYSVFAGHFVCMRSHSFECVCVCARSLHYSNALYERSHC